MDIEEVANNSIDLSALSPDEKKGFKDWLNERSYMQTTIESALRKGQLVKAFIGKKTLRTGADYSIRIEGYQPQFNHNRE